MITSEQVKELRDLTGISIMQCRKALEEANGDMEKAKTFLRKKGADIAAKKADRTLGAGRIAAYVHSSGTVAAMVELSCETDFVAKNEEFYNVARDIAMQIVATDPKYLKIEDITAEEREKMKEVFLVEVDQKKPADIKEKIISGKLDAYFNEQVLLEQVFIKNEDFKIKDLIQGVIQKFGEKTEIRRFVRYTSKAKTTC
jgi:elongation factor Ts